MESIVAGAPNPMTGVPFLTITSHLIVEKKGLVRKLGGTIKRKVVEKAT